MKTIPIRLIVKQNFKEFSRRKVLITGCNGQIGQLMVSKLVDHYGAENVIASDKRVPKTEVKCEFFPLDVTEPLLLEKIIDQRNVGAIFHMAGFITNLAEKQPDECFKVNVLTPYEILKLCKKYNTK